MFWYKSQVYKCDNSLLFWACCLHIVIICMDRGSCLSRDVILIIQIWRGPFYWMAAFIRSWYTSINEMVPKFSKPSILKLWLAQNCWYSSHCLELCDLNKVTWNMRKINKHTNKHKLHLLLKMKRSCLNLYNSFMHSAGFTNFGFLVVIKLKFWRYIWIHSSPVNNGTGLCETSFILLGSVWYHSFVTFTHDTIFCSWNTFRINDAKYPNFFLTLWI